MVAEFHGRCLEILFTFVKPGRRLIQFLSRHALRSIACEEKRKGKSEKACPEPGISGGPRIPPSNATVFAKERARRETLDCPMCRVHAMMRRWPDDDLNHCPNGSAIGCERLQDASNGVIDFRLDGVLVLLIADDWKKIGAKTKLGRERLVFWWRVERIDRQLFDLAVRILRVELAFDKGGEGRWESDEESDRLTVASEEKRDRGFP
jgi:hypothetical protein